LDSSQEVPTSALNVNDMTATSPANDVAAVVVSYHPDPQSLAHLLQAITPQVDRVFVVDNCSPTTPVVIAPTRLIRLPSNQGIARAQNLGVQTARENGARHVLLLDQDSQPEPDMVRQLLAALRAASVGGQRVAAVGPRTTDPDGRSEGFVRFGNGRYESVLAEGQPWVACDMLIASGMLIPREAWETVGEMDARLVSDKVDTEWCLRASAARYALIGAPQARMQHRLGLHRLRIWFLGWRTPAMHVPLRYYYIIRNGLLLRRLPHATRAWKRADARQMMSLLLYFGLLMKGRLKVLKMMWHGLVDGLRGISGPARIR
jgi:rhamnosyltransferase